VEAQHDQSRTLDEMRIRIYAEQVRLGCAQSPNRESAAQGMALRDGKVQAEL
jgi:hypothetical protein